MWMPRCCQWQALPTGRAPAGRGVEAVASKEAGADTGCAAAELIVGARLGPAVVAGWSRVPNGTSSGAVAGAETGIWRPAAEASAVA